MIRLAPYWLIALAMVGVADTLYLSYSVYSGITPSCLLAGCDVVLASSYSKFFGVPLSYIGLVFYTYMLCLAALLAFEPYSRALRVAAVLYTLVGTLLSGAFLYIQGALIGAYCQYCVISAVVALLLFAVALWHVTSTRGA
jgi:uncharacterized membrane protein